MNNMERIDAIISHSLWPWFNDPKELARTVKIVRQDLLSEGRIEDYDDYLALVIPLTKEGWK